MGQVIRQSKNPSFTISWLLGGKVLDFNPAV